MTAWLVAGLGLLAVIIAYWMVASGPDEPRSASGVVHTGPAPIPVTAEDRTAFQAELHQATALPESLRSAFRGVDRFVQPRDTTVPAEREDPPPQVEIIPPTVVTPAPVAAKHPALMPQSRSGRALMYFFDLKLVHPKELYRADPVLELANGSVDSRGATGRAAWRTCSSYSRITRTM
jgi:hypothetical protein